MRGKVIRDALHGDIEFTAAEMALIDTPAMQRLRGIKALGTSNLVYPSAVHTRFEHSLGTAWLAKRLLRELRERGVAIDPEDLAAVPAAALLHDVTHLPFGHTFEDERRIFPRHDEDPERLAHFLAEPSMVAALHRTGVERRIRELLQPGGEVARPFARELISGTVCADLLDYLRRDALYTGLAQAYDDRIFRAVDVDGGHLAIELQKNGLFRHDILSELIHLLRVRYNLTERVYFHHAKTVAGAMISKALELALSAAKVTPRELWALRDDSLLYLLGERCGEVEGVRELLDDLQARRLYKRVFLITPGGYGRSGLDQSTINALAEAYHYDATARDRAERELAADLRVPPSAVVLYCPSPRMQFKEAAVRVRIEGDRVVPLNELQNPEVESLGAKYHRLWRFMVCMRRDYSDRFTRAGQACESLFGAPNMVSLQDSGQLAFDF